MCSPQMFRAIGDFLDKNPKNKVAFLGDYFDKGPHVVNSINEIAELIKKYGERVIIILGNRDVNKFRLIYEMREDPQEVGDDKWSMWTKFYTELPNKTKLHDRLQFILRASMGAGQPTKGKPAFAADAPAPIIDPKLDEHESAYLLIKAFSKQNADLYKAENENKLKDIHSKHVLIDKFVASVQTLFKHGKIVHYDPHFKTLMSHAGGMEPFFFHTDKYYDNIPADLKNTKYYSIIEKIRGKLQDKPIDIIDNFEEVTYNAPLEVCKHMFDSTIKNIEEIPKEYYLLQALGLKPDAGEHFTSFIDSCDVVPGCKGPIAADIGGKRYNDYKEYLKRLKDSGIKFVAAGHVPHCAPVPLIYTRPEDDNHIIFIANDVSNGSRPAHIKSVSQVPLSFVDADETVGIFALGAEEDFNRFGELENMVGKWKHADVPKFKGAMIHYDNGKLIFPSRGDGLFKGAKFEKTDQNKKGKNTEGGGRRRTRHKKRSYRRKTSKRFRV